MKPFDKVRREFYCYKCQCGSTNYMLMNEVVQQPDETDLVNDVIILRSVCTGCGRVTKLNERKYELDACDSRYPHNQIDEEEEFIPEEHVR